MRRIVGVTVEYEDHAIETFQGTGREPMISVSVEEQEGEEPTKPHAVTRYHVTVMSLSLLMKREQTR